MYDTVKVFKNILALLSERLIVPAVNLLLVVFIARILGADGLGRYAAIVGFVSFFDIFLDLGINTLIIRDVARDRSSAGAYLSKAVTLKLAASPAIFLSIFVFLRFFPYPDEVARAFYVFSAAFILIAFSDSINALYKAYERMNLVAFMVFLRQSALVATVVLVMKLGYGITGIALSYLAVGAAYLALNYLTFTLRVSRVYIRVDRKFYKDLFENSLPFITTSFFFLIFYRIDVVLVSVTANDVQAGFFSAASKIVSSLMLLSAAFLEAVFPIISRYEPGSADKMRGALRKAFHLLAAVSLPMSVGMVATAGDALRLLYGNGFAQAKDIYFVLAVGLPIAYLTSALHYVVMAMNMQRRAFFGVATALVLWSAANLWLIKYSGGLGAAYATLGFTACLFVYMGHMVFDGLSDYSALRETLKPLFASLVMGGLLFSLGTSGLLFKIFAGAAAYTAVMWMLRGFDQDDSARVRDLWRHYARQGR